MGILGKVEGKVDPVPPLPTTKWSLLLAAGCGWVGGWVGGERGVVALAH